MKTTIEAQARNQTFQVEAIGSASNINPTAQIRVVRNK
jgi:hypothetical protein